MGLAFLPSAKMLIFLESGEQRLITFTLPRVSCTLQEILEQVNIPVTPDTHIQCMQSRNTEIEYFVAMGSTVRLNELLENHPMFAGRRNSSNSTSEPEISALPTPEESQSSSSSNSPSESDSSAILTPADSETSSSSNSSPKPNNSIVLTPEDSPCR